MFPRLQKRGPIEAKLNVQMLRDALEFPRLQKRGPIEARRVGRGRGAGGRFPRLQKRGPIEALRARGLADASVQSFHAYKSVAPLKHTPKNRSGSDGRVSTLTKAWPH